MTPGKTQHVRKTTPFMLPPQYILLLKPSKFFISSTSPFTYHTKVVPSKFQPFLTRNPYKTTFKMHNLPSVLWRCWLGGRKGIRPVKTEWWGAGLVICLERGADLHMAQLIPLPLTVSCFSKIQIGFTFLVPAHLGRPGKRAVKRVCVLKCTMQQYKVLVNSSHGNDLHYSRHLELLQNCLKSV